MPFISKSFISTVKERQANKGGNTDLFLNPAGIPDGESVRFSPVGDDSLHFMEIWGRTSDGKNRALRFTEEPTPKELADRAADENIALIDKYGKPTSLKQALAMWVWNYSTNSIQLFQATQVGILETIASIFSDEDVADNPAAWDFELQRFGQLLETRYQLTLKPGKRKGTLGAEVAAAWQECEKQGYNLQALLVNGDPTKAAGGIF